MYRRLNFFRVFIASIVILGASFLIDVTLVSQADAQVVFTEVDYHKDLIEIVNMGTSSVDISGWWFCSVFSYREISAVTIVEGNTDLQPGGIIVLSGFALNDAAADLGLYNEINNFGDFGNAAFMEDFVQWGRSPIGRETVAVSKGIWTAGDFVPTVANGNSIEFDGVGVSAGAWFDQATPNFGAFGEEAFVPSIVINEVDYRVTDRIELKNVSSDSVDIGNWFLCSRRDYTPPISSLEIVEGDTNLAPGATIVIAGFSLNDTGADLGLYNRAVFSNPDNMEAFVQWGSSGNGRESEAVQRGIWTAGDFVPLVAEGHSIEYDGDGFASSDWIDQASPTLGVVPVFGVTLEVVGETAQSTDDATAGVTYTLTVTNTGNQDDTINLSVSPEAGIDGSLSTTSVELAAETSQEITLTVTGDALTEAGDYQVTVTTTSAGDTSMTDEISTTTTIETVAVFGVTLEVVGETAQSTDDATAGVTYMLTVTNTGNQDDTINLSVSPEVGIEGSVLGSLSKTSVDLAAGASEEVALTVTGDAFTEAGDYQVTVTATSAGDANMTDEVVTTTTIEISAVFGVTLEVVGETAQSTDDATAGVTYTLTVTNTGNQDDTINLSVPPDVGVEGTVLGSLSKTSVDLAAGASEEVTLTVTGDVLTEARDYQVTVTATSAGDVSMTDEVSTTTTVEVVVGTATPWDVNADGVVNVFDLVLVGGEFGQYGETLVADVDGNGTVNIFDLVIVASHFGEETALAAPAIR